MYFDNADEVGVHMRDFSFRVAKGSSTVEVFIPWKPGRVFALGNLDAVIDGKEVCAAFQPDSIFYWSDTFVKARLLTSPDRCIWFDPTGTKRDVIDEIDPEGSPPSESSIVLTQAACTPLPMLGHVVDITEIVFAHGGLAEAGGRMKGVLFSNYSVEAGLMSDRPAAVACRDGSIVYFLPSREFDVRVWNVTASLIGALRWALLCAPPRGALRICSDQICASIFRPEDEQHVVYYDVPAKGRIQDVAAGLVADSGGTLVAVFIDADKYSAVVPAFSGIVICDNVTGRIVTRLPCYGVSTKAAPRFYSQPTPQGFYGVGDGDDYGARTISLSHLQFNTYDVYDGVYLCATEYGRLFARVEALATPSEDRRGSLKKAQYKFDLGIPLSPEGACYSDARGASRHLLKAICSNLLEARASFLLAVFDAIRTGAGDGVLDAIFGDIVAHSIFPSVCATKDGKGDNPYFKATSHVALAVACELDANRCAKREASRASATRGQALPASAPTAKRQKTEM